MKVIQFICVNYNNSEYSIEFCESLRRQNGLADDFALKCMIIDNSTSIKDSNALREYSADCSWVSCIKASKNLGYFGGLNLGLSSLNTCDSDYIVVCNNDLVFESDFCKKLSSKTYNGNVFSVCPDVVTKDGIHQNPHVLNKISWSRKLQFDIYFSHYYVARLMSWVLSIIRPIKSSPSQQLTGCVVHMGIGACYVLTCEFLKRFKKLNYPHFLYGEEAYFSDQIHSAGGLLWFDPDLVVYHAESATLSKVPRRTAYEFSKSGYPSYRNML
jgi:GT2 family glycosyltransferase